MEDKEMSAETKAGLGAHMRANVPTADLAAVKAAWDSQLAATDIGMVKAEIEILVAEMKKLAEIGDPNSAAAKAAMLRWKTVTAGFSQPRPEVREGLNKGWDEALKDEAVAPQLPIDRKVTTYMREVAVNMRTNGELG